MMPKPDDGQHPTIDVRNEAIHASARAIVGNAIHGDLNINASDKALVDSILASDSAHAFQVFMTAAPNSRLALLSGLVRARAAAKAATILGRMAETEHESASGLFSRVDPQLVAGLLRHTDESRGARIVVRLEHRKALKTLTSLDAEHAGALLTQIAWADLASVVAIVKLGSVPLQAIAPHETRTNPRGVGSGGSCHAVGPVVRRRSQRRRQYPRGAGAGRSGRPAGTCESRR